MYFSVSARANKRNEETRRLQLTGGSTYVISLPKKWIIQNQLKKSSTILVRSEDDGSLSIMPSDLAKQEPLQEAYIMVSPKDMPDPIIRKTVSAYLVGYNTVHIKAKDGQQLSSKQRSSLKSFTRDLLMGTARAKFAKTLFTFALIEDTCALLTKPLSAFRRIYVPDPLNSISALSS
ncbi:MAG: AbrB/MazE/SpoVT family DNA-binding domain-containing protein [Candidatus Bathyarchaeia archaeon]